jgi:hypothetical protein
MEGLNLVACVAFPLLGACLTYLLGLPLLGARLTYLLGLSAARRSLDLPARPFLC